MACLNKGGTCVRKGSGSKCNRGFEEGFCENDGNSGAEQVCCINCMTSVRKIGNLSRVDYESIFSPGM